MSKILTVFGSTGQQGGSVINSVQAHPTLSKEYKIRGVTRDPSKPAAQKLTSKGVEVVQADLGDKDSVRKAVEGSYAVFGVTNFWEIFSKDVEVAQGRNIADACKAAGVSHFIWSSIAHATKVSNGKMSNMSHFDSKAEVEEYTREIGVPSTFFWAGPFMSNFPQALQKTEDGYALANNLAPDTKVPLYEVNNDTSKFVAGILAQTEKPSGKRVFGATGWYTPTEMVATIEKVSGKKVTFSSVSDQVYEGFLPPNIAKELTETFAFIREFAYYGPGAEEGVAESLKIVTEKPTTWEEFVQSTWPWK